MANNLVIYSFRSPYRTLRSVTLAGLTAMSLLVLGCSKPASVPIEAKSDSHEAKSDGTTQPPKTDVSAQRADATDELLPPILKVAWKGDLDEMVKRRIVRVLVPFRRPEFFYMEGRPVGFLQEAFRDYEKVLNANTRRRPPIELSSH